MRRVILFHREHRFWKNRKNVHDQTRIGVHDGAESVFMMDQNGCSRSTRICNTTGLERKQNVRMLMTVNEKIHLNISFS